MRSSSAPVIQWFLLALPAAVFFGYFLTAFPHRCTSTPAQPSLASLPADSPSWDIYPEDFYEGGAYARLPQGTVRYWLIGPENGERIVLIHGLSVPAIIWKEIAPQLAQNGFRVLLYDLYGRGYSDAPQTTYDVNLYTTQLALLMQYVGWSHAHIAGVSMGGGIAAAFSAQFPHLVTDRLALVACTGLLNPSDLSRTSKFLSSPIVQLVASSYPFRRYLQYLASGKSAREDPIAELVRIQSAYLPGFNPAIASSLRDGPIRDLAPSFAALGQRHANVVVIWGTADTVVPYRSAARVRAHIPDAQMVTIDGGGHDILVSHPATVGRALVRFFSDKRGQAARQ
ncbi:alpha/beta-hydrolase [Wolfiporia cocos MD-104 SS10]|uniref:Alpha/beta-hydrolase n=1 Tax=Wolfiporia cocos (strain MD-104) TaxID=742152 RepID=A0A2H3JLH3_WOLCO|nr:alpha/beta-hydrolase [Wolfiporia cocos MD-104 SS10]